MIASQLVVIICRPQKYQQIISLLQPAIMTSRLRPDNEVAKCACKKGEESAAFITKLHHCLKTNDQEEKVWNQRKNTDVK